MYTPWRASWYGQVYWSPRERIASDDHPGTMGAKFNQDGDRTMTDSRINPPYVGAERPMLESWLEYHRATLALKCDGLSVEQLRRRAVPPSTLSLLGLIRHMAEVERSWFQRTIAGTEAPPMYYSDADPDGDFDHVDDADPDEAFAAWREACDTARKILAGVSSLDDLATRQRQGESVSVRWIVVHMIEEYARHNGHADLLRECIDGVTGD
jgi:uncharacterized damage-inducible protein DinB